MSLWIVRHGERLDQVDPGWRDTAERKHDPPLTEEGKRQAKRTGERLVRSRIHRIVSSPALRCVETAHVIADILNLDVCVEPAIREFAPPGTFEEDPEWLACDVLAKDFEYLDPGYEKAPDAPRKFPEETTDATARCKAATDHLRQRYPKENILLVGHAFMHTCVYDYLLKSTPNYAGAIGYCALTKFHQPDRSGICAVSNIQQMPEYQCDMFCDESHVKDGE